MTDLPSPSDGDAPDASPPEDASLPEGAGSGQDEAEGARCTRRCALNTFLTCSAAAVGGSVVYPIATFLLPPHVTESSVASVVAGKVSDFPLNSGRIFRMGSKPGLLIRLPDGTFRAFSAICTHLSCRVQYRPDSQLVWCACHDGSYDLNGKNVSGPPPRPLEQFSARVLGDEVIVSRGEA